MSVYLENPFVVGRYVAPEYFCDRIKETNMLMQHIINGRDVALVSPRRMGKSGLIEHVFLQSPIREQYYTFYIDIYGTNSYAEFVYLLGKSIYEQLKPKPTVWKEKFFQVVRSLQVGVQFDPISGIPQLNLQFGDIQTPDITLDEIFEYIELADKRCVIAFDEFQQISTYTDDKSVEAKLRTKIQHCKNAHFIYSGSKRHLMTQMFFSSTKPFYQSAASMGLDAIPLEAYTSFVQDKFAERGKAITPDVIEAVYHKYDGTSWFIQMMMNEIFATTAPNETYTIYRLDETSQHLIGRQDMAYRELMKHIPTKQKQVLLAIAKAGVAQAITSGNFIKTYKLPSPSSVQAAVKGLLEEDLITQDNGCYRVYDYFFGEWLKGRY